MVYIYDRKGKIKIVSSSRLDDVDGLSQSIVRSNAYNFRNIISNFVMNRGRLKRKGTRKRTGLLKIAMVSVWDIPCGISTYAEFLVQEIRDLGHEVRIFAEHAEDVVDDAAVERCWDRGKSLSKLSKRLGDYNPDLTFIQHEYGIFPNATKWTKFISDMQDYEYHVVLHSVYNHEDKTVCEAICKNIIVHTELAKQVLVDKGVSSTINVIPHGCVEVENTDRLWNIYKNPHTVMQFGFGFDYKGWDVSLDAIAILREKYPDIFYLILFSESKFVMDFHDAEYDKIKELIEERDLSENVAVIRGFQTDEALSTFLRTNRIAVFPYTSDPEHVVYGSSGAVRMALANGIPTVTSKVPHFSDLKGVVPRIDSPGELAAEISALFSDSNKYRALVKRQLDYVKQNTWKKTAKKYLSV